MSTGMTATELLQAYRRAVVELERAYQAWSATTPGSADASVAYDVVSRMWRTVENLEEELEHRLDQ